MAAQRAQSRSITAFSETGAAFKRLTAEGVGSEFVGYEEKEVTSEILLLVRDGEEVSEASAGDQLEVVTRSTPLWRIRWSGGR